MNKEEKLKFLKKQYDNLSEVEKASCKMLFNNFIEFEYDEVEENGVFKSIITDRRSGESYDLFEYVKDKSNIINSSFYLHDVRR